MEQLFSKTRHLENRCEGSLSCSNGSTLRDTFGVLGEEAATAGVLRETSQEEEEVCSWSCGDGGSLYVCCNCGLVLEDIFQPDVHWLDHAMMARQYTNMDRLNAVDKTTLADFLNKVGWYDSLPLHDVQELLKAMKFRRHFKKSQLCHCPGMHTRGTWAASREDFPVSTTLKRSLGKEFNSPGSRTVSFRENVVKKPTQAHPL